MLGLSVKKHSKKIIIGAMMVLGLCSVVPAVSPLAVHAAPPAANGGQPASPGGQPAASGGQGSQSTNCAVEKLGWILCPIIETAAKISDKTFDILASNFLQTDPALLSTKGGTQTAWGVARNLANIMFIVAFLIIIVSQVTGMGINNYGIKKMIPKLIVAAVAVNVSFYICQIVVDLTNILGWEVENMLVQIANGIGPSVFGNASQYGVVNTGNAVTGTILTVIAGAALAVAAAVWVTLPMVISVILFVLITTATIVIILLLRKALIVLLVVISPIAFVMYLLPNTERYFDRWMKMFGQLLMVFPVVGLLFGAGQLASTIILVSGAETQAQVDAAQRCNPDNPQQVRLFDQGKDANGNPQVDSNGNPINGANNTCGGGAVQIYGDNNGQMQCGQQGGGCTRTASWQMGLVATGIAVAPLMAVWAVLKGALSAAGAIGGKISSVGGKLAGGRLNRAKEDLELKKMQNATNYMQGGWRGRTANVMSGGGIKRGLRRKAIGDYAKSANNKESMNYVSEAAIGEDGELTRFGRQLAGGRSAMETDKERVKSDAVNAQRKLMDEEMQAASRMAADRGDDELHATIDKLDTDELAVNDPAVAAAINELGRRNDFKALEKVMNKVSGAGPSLASRTLSSTISDNASQFFTGGQIANIARGAHSGSYMETVANNLANGALTPEKMATLNPSLANEASHVIGTASASADANLNAAAAKAMQNLSSGAAAVMGDSILNKRIGRITNQLGNYQSQSHNINR